MTTGKEKILALESLRGMAALSVVIYHDGSSSALLGNIFFQHAHVMVDFFFVLSGYVIALNYFDRIDGFGALLKFQKKRFWRLYPLHLFTLMAFLGIECAKYLFELRTGIVANNPAFSANDAWAFIANLSLTQAFLQPYPSFNIPSWSISAEFYTYLFFALLLLLPRRVVVIPAAAVVAYLFMAWAGEGSISDNYALTLPRCIQSFLIGACVHLIMRGRTISFSPITQPLALVAALLGVMAFGDTSAEIVLPILFAVVVLVFATDTSYPAARLLSARPLVYLGTISYSVYMTHSMVWWFSNQVLRFGFGFSTYIDESGFTQVIAPYGFGVVVTLSQVALTIAVAHLTYMLIEKRFRSGLPRGRLSRRREPANA